MSTSDPEFHASDKFPPKSDEAPTRQRGCFFYGCLISGILGMLLLIAVGIGAYVVYRAFTDFVEQNTATAPRNCPRSRSRPRRAWRSRRKSRNSRSPSLPRSPTRPLS